MFLWLKQLRLNRRQKFEAYCCVLWKVNKKTQSSTAENIFLKLKRNAPRSFCLKVSSMPFFCYLYVLSSFSSDKSELNFLAKRLCVIEKDREIRHSHKIKNLGIHEKLGDNYFDRSTSWKLKKMYQNMQVNKSLATLKRLLSYYSQRLNDYVCIKFYRL